MRRSVPAFGEYLNGSTDALSYGARIEAGHRFAFGRSGLTPYLAGTWQALDVSAFRESGTGAAVTALSVAGRRAGSLRTEVGVGFDVPIAGAPIVLHGRAAWLHQFDRDRDAAASFTALPGSGFAVRGARPDANAALARLGVTVAGAPNIALRAEVIGEFLGNVSALAGTARVNIAF